MMGSPNLYFTASRRMITTTRPQIMAQTAGGKCKSEPT